MTLLSGVAVHNDQLSFVINPYDRAAISGVQHTAVQVQGDVFPDIQGSGQVDVAGEPDVAVFGLNGGLQSGLVRDGLEVFRRAGETQR